MQDEMNISISLLSHPIQKSLRIFANNVCRGPSIFGFGFGPGPTIGSKSSHKAHIYSDARTTFNDTKSEPMMPDSWDSQGIYTKREFELTTMEVRAQRGNDIV